uniref:Chromo domain-containing protein n=1 Tax=Nymphaea colorata TaxID=210225 RepID=A0A5K1DJE2_9MAGN
MHPVFHVSKLKTCPQPPTEEDIIEGPINEDQTKAVPSRRLGTRMINQKGSKSVEWLIEWNNTEEGVATWEKAEDIINRFPDFAP